MDQLNLPLSVAACTCCGLSTNTPQLLRPHIRSLRLQGKTQEKICPQCAASKVLRVHWINFLLGVLGVIALTLWVFLDPSPRRGEQSALIALIGLFYFPIVMVVAHEAAHAVVAKLVGFRLFGITIGIGPRLATIRCGRVQLKLHLLPAGGYCVAVPDERHRQRWRMILMVAAGPLVHFVAIALTWWLDSTPFRFNADMPFGDWRASFIFSNAVLLLVSLFPGELDFGSRRLASDGLLIWRLVKSDKLTSQWAGVLPALDIDDALERGDLAMAREILNASRRSIVIRVPEFKLLAAEHRWPEVLERTRQTRRIVNDPAMDAVLATWQAVAIVYSSGDLAEARACVETMHATMPWDGSCITAHAAVALAGNDLAEAHRLLMTGRRRQRSAEAQCAAAWMWHRLYELQNDARRSQRWRRKAERLDPRRAYAFPAGAIQDRAMSR